jgi:hypothetical protein
MRGLGPRHHLKKQILFSKMDLRVKFTLGPAKGGTRVPGNDGGWVEIEGSSA